MTRSNISRCVALFTRTETWIFKRWFRRSERFVVHGQALADELAPGRRTRSDRRDPARNVAAF